MPEETSLSRPAGVMSPRHRGLWLTLSGIAIIAALLNAVEGNWWRAVLFALVGWAFTRR